jgi:CIC family chloride channel protein
LILSRLIQSGGARDEVKRRLRVLALLLLGALGLYYPLLALTAINSSLGIGHDLLDALAQLPWWMKLLSPSLGGALVGYMLRTRPETHGHGVPEVVMAVKNAREGLHPEGGLLKLVASAMTIGSGGSAGREGPIVYGGAAFASGVGRTLGFSRKELAILMACGAGAGISASFNAPIAGAMFAMEIILREFELKVFSPIILASVTATMVSRGVIGSAPMLQRVGYEMVSGWEIIGYVGLGLVTGLLAFAFVRMLHHTEGYFSGHFPGRLSAWLGRRNLPTRAAIGGFCAGLMAMANPIVWGSGHDVVNLAAVGKLGLWFLLVACALKLVATVVTIGSGGSGGTFFPAAAFGAMAGGAFGDIAHRLFPTATASSGAWAVVGMGGAVAALTRGPLTGLMMMYELSSSYAIILPLMVTCTIASALCHYLVERGSKKPVSDVELLSRVPVRHVMREIEPVPGDTRLRELLDRLLDSGDGVLAVREKDGSVRGIVQLDQLRQLPRELAVTASDLAHKVPQVSPDLDLASAVRVMELEDAEALPVLDGSGTGQRWGLITRAAARRFLFSQHALRHEASALIVAPTEVT